MQLDDNQRFDLLVQEIGLLQGRFDKYDDLIFRQRGWLVTIIVALLGAALTVPERSLTYLAAGVPVAFWVVEMIWRSGYWYKYVVRYRHLRTVVNSETSEITSVCDLTHHYGDQPAHWQRFKACAFRVEPAVFYSSLLVASLIVNLFVAKM